MGWSIVLQSKRRILGIDNVEYGEEYNQFDENPPFSIGLPSIVREDNVDENYARNDHDEGQWFDHQVFDMDEDNREESSKEVSKKRTRGPTICNPIGDMRRDFRTYVGSVVRFQVDINVVVNDGLKDAIWDDIKFIISVEN
ncbi:hypothetical protein POM88_039340 [Heracleum sosnowskyi]|uniref:Uncharacterized protein n=1 Tax=Heracleum sosnowskyi TaxID=360622 RepID=A0AAD8HCJ1_9APIA|nr:hypothetical protein POM88_039340 [Heracleum sosnowskyi]